MTTKAITNVVTNTEEYCLWISKGFSY